MKSNTQNAKIEAITEKTLVLGKDNVVPGMEPTGHYWFNLEKFLQDNEMKPVLVNPHHVKKSKELDDNNPTKNDRKNPKVIAGLVREGRYMIPYLPDGVYADLRTASNIRFQLQEKLTGIQNRISRWFNICFPEYKTVYATLVADLWYYRIKEDVRCR